MLRLDVARPRECINRAALPASHLCDDMSGRTETINSEMLAVPGHDQRTPADQARAKQRGERDVVARLPERKAIAGISDEVRGKTAIARVAGEQWAVAKVFLAIFAVCAFAAGVAEPGNPDALADLDGGHTGAKRLHPTDHFMAGNDGIIDAGQLAIHDVQIGPAHAADAHPDAHDTGSGRRIVPLLKLKRRTGRRQNHGVHRVCGSQIDNRIVPMRRRQSLILVKWP